MAIKPFRLTLASPGNNYHHSCTENQVKIGRSLNCEFSVPREDLSREHCLVEVEGDDIYITDLGSKNGVLIDRVRIATNKKTKVSTSSFIVLSNVYTLKFNSLEVKTKTDMVLSRPVSPEAETVTYKLLLPVEKPKRFKRMPMRRMSKIVPEDAEVTASIFDSTKMILAFLAVIALILYQALGR